MLTAKMLKNISTFAACLSTPYMKKFYAILCLLFPWVIQAQTYTIRGYVADTLNENHLQYASITLIRSEDSILENFTRTDAEGKFALHIAQKGSYVLMVSFPGFAEYIDRVVVENNPEIDLGIIPMVTKSHLLSEFVLKQQISAIKIKGDTTEYMADSFLVKENATVEELLKKLPGISVNKSGEITAHGEKVQKILVDGEEFFTDDPAVVTKSLQAKTVESVQVYDKKSDEAIFTGIDDGVREKTINLKLKENMKKGLFGKLVLGGGTDGFFENQAMVNAFKGKRKLSVFGIMANTGKIGLGWADADKFGGGSDSRTISVNDDGTITTIITSDEDGGWGGMYNGRGLPVAWTGGLHYSNKWFEDKLHLASNYRFARQNIETVNNNLNEINLADSKIYTSDRNSTFRTGDRHRVSAFLEWKTDSTSQIKLSANAGLMNTINKSQGYKNTQSENGELLNDNTSSQDQNGTTKYINAVVNWQKKFAKKGRSLMVSMDESYRENQSDNYIQSALKYYNPVAVGVVDSTVVNNQKKENQDANFQFSGRASYTEPLSKIMFLEVNYGITVNNSQAKKYSYEKSSTGAYDSLNMIFSSDYDFDVFTQTGGSNLKFVFKKFNFSIGGSVASTSFSQKDKLGNTFSYTRHFTNFFPRANFSYRPQGKQTSINISYSGSTQQPTMEQIQPLRQNTDLLNESIGNPSLRQEFNHTINVNFNDYKVLSNTYKYAGIGFNFVDDDISRTEFVNAGGKRIYQYVNINGNYRGWFWGGMGKHFPALDLRLGIHSYANFNNTNNIINGLKNKSQNASVSLSVSADYDKSEKFNLKYSPGVTYNSNTSTINSGSATNFWTYQQEIEGSVQLPFKFELGTEITWYIREKVTGFDRNNNVLIWNAYISKKFLKSDALELKASVYDILNQNIGFQRYGYGNMVNEETYNTIRRYGMLSLIWNFSKTFSGGGSNSEEESTESIMIEK